MAVDDSLDVCQADARAFEFRFIVEPLENPEKFARKLHIKADAVIAHEKDLLARLSRLAADLDFGVSARTAVLKSVREQVDHYLMQERRIGLDFRQSRNFPDNVPAICL